MMAEFAFAAELESLARIRNEVKQFSEHQNFSEQFTYDLLLCVDEACTNIIKHGYEGMNPGSILLDFIRVNDRVEITLTDFGHPFEPAPPPRPDVTEALEGDQVGGFGLYIIYETMDDIEYEATPAGNHLRLTKYLND
jgi:serine/threonine-protein kinase RsbW